MTHTVRGRLNYSYLVSHELLHLLIYDTESCGSNAQDIDRFELSAQHRLALESKPSIQHSCIDTAKVCVEFQGAVVQVREAGM